MIQEAQQQKQQQFILIHTANTWVVNTIDHLKILSYSSRFSGFSFPLYVVIISGLGCKASSMTSGPSRMLAVEVQEEEMETWN